MMRRIKEPCCVLKIDRFLASLSPPAGDPAAAALRRAAVLVFVVTDDDDDGSRLFSWPQLWIVSERALSWRFVPRQCLHLNHFIELAPAGPGPGLLSASGPADTASACCIASGAVRRRACRRRSAHR